MSRQRDSLSNSWIRMFHPTHWNTISHLYSFFTVPSIGSPVEFSGPDGLFLKEWNVLDMPDSLRRQYLAFCYPEDLKDREQEIAYDRQYWPHSSTILIYDNPYGIVGTVQLVPWGPNHKLPVEFARIAGRNEMLNICDHSRAEPALEIYRLRRSFSIDSHKAPILVTMLFKAIWAKILETHTRYLYLSYDSDSAELGNLYKRRLGFEETGIALCYGESNKEWNLLCKDCLRHEQEYAAQSPRNFYFQTYCRANLKHKRYRVMA